VRHVLVNPQGRVTIPAALRRELGIDPGTTVVAYVEEGRLVLERRAHLLARLQARVAEASAASGQTSSVVEELLAERRAEAAAEDSRA